MSVTEEIAVPGTFVVFQGIPGDGLCNTIDTVPDIHNEVIEAEANSHALEHSTASDSSGFHQNVPTLTTTTTTRTSNTAATAAACGTLVTPSLTGLLNPAIPRTSLGLNSLVIHTTTAPPAAASLTNHHHNNNTVLPPISVASEDSFIVVSEDSESSTEERNRDVQEDSDRQQQTQSPTLSPSEARALQAWRTECRQQEALHHAEWLQGAPHHSGEEQTWWLDQGRLAIFESLPQPMVGTRFFPQACGTLSPGMIVVGTELVTISSKTFRTINVQPTMDSTTGIAIYPRGRDGWIQLLKLQSPKQGYIALSLNGYDFVGPGLPANYADPEQWFWRVTCPVGAWVREGLDLSTPHSETLPHGCLIRVKRKTVNAMGLSRLRIETRVQRENGSQHVVEGWCSEFLNPLSGQRGPIVQPVPFPVPVQYRVTLPEGAIIRSDIDLSSPQIGHAPCGAILTITGRAYSEHPADKCIERLRVAGNGGWISLRLNKLPPNDTCLVEMVGVEGSFDPDHPGFFHLDALRRIQAQQGHESDRVTHARTEAVSSARSLLDISSIDEDEGSSSVPFSSSAHERQSPAAPSCTYSAQACAKAQRTRHVDEHCLICLTEERTATIVHGETGHFATCLTCARILKARGDPCPVCRLPIDLVIRQFWA